MPLVEILNSLFQEGITVSHTKIRKIKFITCHILGDNLGMNSLFGFTESFVANYYCRICRSNKLEMGSQQTKNIEFMRNPVNYLEDVVIQNVSITGVKEDSVWNNIINFHVTKNIYVDIMHDILEGVCHYDLSNIILNCIIDRKLFTLSDLNTFIRTFNYGPLNRNKKNYDITLEMLKKNKNLFQKL